MAVPFPWARVRPHLAYLAYLAAVALVGGYALTVGYRTVAAYAFLKGDHLGFRGRVHRADPDLGFAAIPGARGEHVFPSGPPLPMHYSALEFRVPASDPGGSPRQRPFVLALGCSFTYGDACLAEDTYPERVAAGLGGTALNGGKCAYGLAQMLILARRDIPRYRPEYVLVQSSPWLAGRGTSGVARATFGSVPVPALTLSAGGEIGIRPPTFRTRVFDLPVADYDRRDRGLREFLGFAWRVGLPLFMGDDLDRARARLGRAGDPQEDDRRRARLDQDQLNRRVYAEIAGICARSGARMALVRLSHPQETHYPQLKELWSQLTWVDAQAALDTRATDVDDYYRKFGHWRGDPPVLVDTHPNPAAHRIIADEILRALRRSPGPDRGVE